MTFKLKNLLRCLSAAALAGLLVFTSGCRAWKQHEAERYVYVTAKQAYLRERVAAVSNRTGEVQNGEKLVVLDRAKRFVKVRSPRNEVGWIEEKLTASQETADRFTAMATETAKSPAVATAVTRDEVNLHVSPGRKTESFYRLPENETLSLLKRASVEKPVTPGAPAAKSAGKEDAPAEVPAIPMEDWWLARTKDGHTGWIYSRLIDVAAPDAIVRYAEGQRIVAAYQLDVVTDPESGVLNNGQTVTEIPEYVAVLGPYKAGLPYDFDQVRVFTWNLKKHRYETAFREHNIYGFLPLDVGTKRDPTSHAANAQVALPGFTFHALAEGQPVPVADSETGEFRPGKLVAKTYRLEGNVCRRAVQPGEESNPAEEHLVIEPKKTKGKRKGR